MAFASRFLDLPSVLPAQIPQRSLLFEKIMHKVLCSKLCNLLLPAIKTSSRIRATAVVFLVHVLFIGLIFLYNVVNKGNSA